MECLGTADRSEVSTVGGAVRSFAFADPELGIGFAYVMNKMDFYGTGDPREVALREAMYRCIENLDD